MIFHWHRRAITLWSVLLSLSTAAWGASIQLRPGRLLQCAGTNLVQGAYTIPCVTDWNGDGRKDLLLAYQVPDNIKASSRIALFCNSGSDAEPVFTNRTILQADGQDIYLPSQGCGAPAPWVFDMDGDGKRDLLVGSGSDGTVYYYRNTNTDAHPQLACMGQLKVGVDTPSGVTNLSVERRSIPSVDDWDGDGLPDLLCGSGGSGSASYIYFFRNTNTAHAPIYAPGAKIVAGGVELATGIRSVVRVCDWDGDGLKDIVCSCDTNVFWCRNTNASRHGMPVLEAPQALFAANGTNGLSPLIWPTGSRLRVLPVDWNNDGVLDLLVGQTDGTVVFFEGYSFGFTRIEPADGRVTLEWNSAAGLSYDLWTLSDACGGSRTVARVPSGGNRTSWTNAVAGSQRFFRLEVAE